MLNTIDWHEWAPSEVPMPYPPGLSFTDRIYAKFRDSSTSKIRIVGDLRWDHDHMLPDDIIAWRFSHHVDEGDA